jgi:hypothetical protein
MQNLLHNLNPEQLAAVTHPQHPAAHADAIRALTEALEL